MSVGILDSARSNFEAALRVSDPANLPDAGWRWESYCVSARRLIERYKTPLDAIHYIQAPASNSGFEARFVGDALKAHAEVMEQNCAAIFPQFAEELTSFAETELSHEETVTELNGRLVSSPLYNHIIHTMRCMSLYPEAKRILEIGGGYGAPGRVWMTNGVVSPRLYVSVDFPETLFYAEVYLRATMPEMSVRYITEDAAPDLAGTGSEIWLCPISNLGALKETQFDIVTNTGSLQEMTDEYVDFYMRTIDSLSTNRFYSANYFCQPIDDLKESMNFGAPIMGPHWVAEFLDHSNDTQRGVAEAFYVRQDIDGLSQQQLNRELASLGPTNTPAAFTKLFDVLRCLEDPSVCMEQLSKALVEMPYVPKEAVRLAQMAQAKSVTVSHKDAALTLLLETMAENGRESSGIVDPTVAEIRDRLMNGQAISSVSSGTIGFSDGVPEVEIDGTLRGFRSGSFGAVEQLERQGQGVHVSGWVADREQSQGAKAVHVFDGSSLVDSISPSKPRPEFDMGETLIGFDCFIPLASTDDLYLVAELEGGQLGNLNQPNE